MQQSGGSGTLIATAEADSYNAAIGGNSGRSSGLITINGGVIDATGAAYGAGIGGGNRHIGTVTINGGSVTATGGSGASAIGCGKQTNYGSCSIRINGGQIAANGGVSSKYNDSKQGSITLNWTDDSKAAMSLTADSYSGAVTLIKTFRDENGSIYDATDSADNSALAGKTLTPYERKFAKYSLSLSGSLALGVRQSKSAVHADGYKTPFTREILLFFVAVFLYNASDFAISLFHGVSGDFVVRCVYRLLAVGAFQTLLFLQVIKKNMV